MNEEQTKAFNSLKRGKNIFLTGSGGTGKSYLIQKFEEWCKKNYKRIAITSTTGISALLINGMTIHSFAGIGLGERPVNELIERIKEKSFHVRRWNSIDILVIDEVSMMKPELFEKLDIIGRTIRNDHSRVFGGIQVVLVGDFAQLPPVYIDNIPEKQFCFESDIWDTVIEEIHYLTKIHRQNEEEFKKCLQEARLGKLSTESIKLLESRKIKKAKQAAVNDIIPTRLFARKKNVDYINNKNLNKLKKAKQKCVKYESSTKCLGFKISDSQRNILTDKINKSCPAIDELELVHGAQVMLLHNLDIEMGLVNGSRGIIDGFDDFNLPIVKFVNGKRLAIDYHTWKISENKGKVQVHKTQIPLMVAYALTIHKCQGSTLDYAVIRLDNVFECGQSYVALSRVRTIEGLFIKGDINPDLISCNEKVLIFYLQL